MPYIRDSTPLWRYLLSFSSKLTNATEIPADSFCQQKGLAQEKVNTNARPRSYNMDHFDVAVIGAGPAGSMAAKYAAKAGASTILLEEHAGAGWPVQCAGLLGREALGESELAAGSFIL